MALDPEHVAVPDLVGSWLTFESLREFHLASHGLRLASSDPDGPPPGELAREGGWLVVAQAPPAGTLVERPSTVWVTAERLGGGGGQAGDREPREPRPPVGRLSFHLDEPFDEA